MHLRCATAHTVACRRVGTCPVPVAFCLRRSLRCAAGIEPVSVATPAVQRRAVLATVGLLTCAHWLPGTGSGLALGAEAAGITTVFVAGSTGNTGRRIVEQLRAKGYNVRAGAKDMGKAKKLGLGGSDPGVVLVTADVLGGQGKLEEAIGDAQAVICATGYTGFNPSGFGQVDETGTQALIVAAKARVCKHFVLVSSLLTNARAQGQQENPNFKFLNLFGGVLDHKLVAEQALKASGLTYTIVRPGGLSMDPPEKVGNLVPRPEDTLFGLDTDPGREISRDTVAAVCVAALEEPTADNVVVEVVSNSTAPVLPQSQWFPKNA